MPATLPGDPGYSLRKSLRQIGPLMLSVGLVASALLIVLGVLWLLKAPAPQVHAQDVASQVATTADESAVPVRVIKPLPAGIERSTRQPGTIRAFDYEELYAKVSGYLVNQKVDIGSKVKKGEVVAEIDAPELVEEAAHAAAAVDQAKSQVRQMEAHVSAAKAELEAARVAVDLKKAEVKRASSSLSYRKKQFDRIKELADYKSVDQRLVDEQFEHLESAEAGKDAAVAGVHSSLAEVEAKKAKVLQAEADLDAARASVKVADSALQKANVFVGFTKLRSYYDGVVTLRSYHDGDFIHAGDQGRPLFVIQRQELMRLIVQVPDADAPYCDPGDPVDLTISTLPGVHLKTKIARVSHSQDQQSRTMRAEADLPNLDHVLQDGMYGEATIHLESSAKNAVRLPSAAVKRDEGKTVVFVVRDGVAHPVPVAVGQDNGEHVEILSGLGANEQVVISSSRPLHDGSPVAIGSPATARASH